ncbi:MAG TPA: mobile mystery protein A [Caulobacteraceae bacterium]|nr:mobile mystery protein A [Caulobacteraceae bacterium]
MITSHEQLDRRFAELRPLAETAVRPSRGWIRAVRDALGMTTAQFARRMGVKQPRIIELEKGEARGAITLQSLERAAKALDCRVIYVLLPVRPLGETLHARAAVMADQQLVAVEQTMGLEDQAVPGGVRRAQARADLIKELLRRPARLWDAP